MITGRTEYIGSIKANEYSRCPDSAMGTLLKDKGTIGVTQKAVVILSRTYHGSSRKVRFFCNSENFIRLPSCELGVQTDVSAYHEDHATHLPL